MKGQIAASVLFALLAAPLFAQTYTWDAGSFFPPSPAPSVLWSDPFNWDGNSAPPAGGGGANVDLEFGPIAVDDALTPINNIGSPFDLDSLTFLAGAPSYQVDGLPLNFVQPLSTIVNDSSSTQQIHNPVLVSNGLTLVANTADLEIHRDVTGLADNNVLEVAGASDTEIVGTISNIDSLGKTGDGNLFISGTATIDGPTNVNAGDLHISGEFNANGGLNFAGGGAGFLSGTVNVDGSLQVGVDGDISVTVVLNSGTSLVAAGANVLVGDNGNRVILLMQGDAEAFLAGDPGTAVRIADTIDSATTGLLRMGSNSMVHAGDIRVSSLGSGAIGQIYVANGGIFRQNSDADLILGSASGEGSASIIVENGSTFSTSVTGTTLIDATGLIRVGIFDTPGTLDINGPMTVSGGRIVTGSDNELELDSGSLLMATNGATFDLGHDLFVHNNSRFEILDSSVATVFGNLQIGANNVGTGEGTIVVSGADTLLDVRGDTVLDGSARQYGSLSVEQEAFVSLSTSESLTTLFVGVNGDGRLEVGTGNSSAIVEAGHINVAVSPSSADGIVTVRHPGSMLTQLSDSTLSLGNNSGTGTAVISVSRGGTFTSGTGPILINNNGALTVRGETGASETGASGTFVARGPMTVRGEVRLPQLDGVPTDPGGVLEVNAGLTIDGGTVALSDGLIDADTITLVNGGQFDFTGGTLRVETFDGDLSNEGGTLAPGDGSLSRTTSILGDADFQPGSTLAINVLANPGGIASDRVDATGLFDLNGELQVMVPQQAPPSDSDSTILSASNITGTFANALDGQRIEAADGNGSFLVNYVMGGATSAITEIVLSDFQLITGLPGDYNDDGVVNAADYVVWRNHEGTDFELPNRDPDAMGNIDGDDYQFWVDNFGNAVGGSAIPKSAFRNPHSPVPEPACLILLLAIAAWPGRACCRESFIRGIKRPSVAG